MAHWPSGPVLACARHAQQLVSLGKTMGVVVLVFPIPPTEDECVNCKNEAEKGKGMSRFVPTNLGVFRGVLTGKSHPNPEIQDFLFRCPECGEWLPMKDEAVLSGKASISSALKEPHLCEYEDQQRYGPTLLAAILARKLTGSGSYMEDEAEAIKEAERLRDQDQ